MNATAQLLPPRPAYRFQMMTQVAQTPNDPMLGRRPALRRRAQLLSESRAERSSGDRHFRRIRQGGAQNDAIRSCRHQPRARGICVPTTRRRSDSKPPVKARPRWWMNADGTRTMGGRSFIDILEPPGTYTVKLSAGGQEFTQKLVVLKDPNSGGSEAEIMEQTQLSLKVKDTFNTAAETVNVIESLRAQIIALKRAVGTAPDQQAAARVRQRSGQEACWLWKTDPHQDAGTGIGRRYVALFAGDYRQTGLCGRGDCLFRLSPDGPGSAGLRCGAPPVIDAAGRTLVRAGEGCGGLQQRCFTTKAFPAG